MRMHRFSFVSLINYKVKTFLVRKVVLPEVCFRGRFLLSNRKPFALTSTRPWTSLGEIGNYTKYIFPTISLLSFICSNTKLFYQLMGGGEVFIYACVDSATKHLPRHQQVSESVTFSLLTMSLTTLYLPKLHRVHTHTDKYSIHCKQKRLKHFKQRLKSLKI